MVSHLCCLNNDNKNKARARCSPHIPPSLFSSRKKPQVLCLQRIHKQSFSYSIFREYPPITSDQQRQLYKRNFDSGLQEYKSLQAELDEINKELSRLDKELDDYREESEEYMVNANPISTCYIELYSTLGRHNFLHILCNVDTGFASYYSIVISLRVVEIKSRMKVFPGIPVVAQWKRIRLGTMKLSVQSLASLSG